MFNKNSKNHNVAIVGSTGAVGVELLKVLENRSFPIKQLSLFASKRSAGVKQKFKNEEIEVKELNEKSFDKDNFDFAFFSAGGENSKKFAPIVAKTGAIVIDNSSAFRMDENIPLVIPEINSQTIFEKFNNNKNSSNKIIANPNCSTIILLMAVYPIHKINPIQKIIVSTYQAASGAGKLAMIEMETLAKAYLETGVMPESKVLKYPLAFNAFSHNTNIDLESGNNDEETKIINETHKILNNKNIFIHPTCIRISTFRAHGESIYLELKNNVDLENCKNALESFPGVKVVDDRIKNYFPMPLEVSGKDEVWVGRLRNPKSNNNVLEMWCCGDQILKGAALNAVQIAEKIISNN